MDIRNIKNINRKNIVLLIILVLALLVLFGGALKNLVIGPSNEQIIKVLEEKGPKLKVETPAAGAKINTEFTVTGKAKVPGQYIRAILRDAQGNILQRQTTRMKERHLDWTGFKIPFTYTGKYRGKAELEVYWLYYRDVSRRDVTKIPVNLPPEQTESIQPVQPEQTSQPGQPVQPPQPGKTPLSFTVLDLSAAPKGLRELAGQNREKATATGIKLEGNVYLLITRGVKPTGGYNVEIGPVTQETKAGRTVIVVAVKYTDPKPDQMVTQAITYPMVAAKLNLKTIPHGLSFVFIPEAR